MCVKESFLAESTNTRRDAGRWLAAIAKAVALAFPLELALRSRPIFGPCAHLSTVSVQADDAVARESAFDTVHDTEAFVAANDDVIIAVFRGSQGGRDWLTNLSILPRDVPQEWNLDTEDGDLHRVGTCSSLGIRLHLMQ